MRPFHGPWDGGERQGRERLGWKSFQGSPRPHFPVAPGPSCPFWVLVLVSAVTALEGEGQCGSCPFGWGSDDCHGTFWLRHGALDLALITSALGHELCVQVCNRALECE